MDGQAQRLLRLHPLVSTVSDDFLDVTFDGMITSRLHPFTTLFGTFIAFTLLLQVQPTYGKKEETASLGGEFDKLSKGCQRYLKVMMTPANLIGSCTQLAVSARQVLDIPCSLTDTNSFHRVRVTLTGPCDGPGE